MTRGGSTLITGADGYLGRRIAQQLLADDSGGRLVLAVHATGRAALRARADQLTASFGPAEQDRIEVVGVDLADPSAFAAVDPTRLTRIVHTAAVTRFNVEQDLARAVNVEGTGRLVEFARRCPRLERLGVLSTIYSSGLVAGPVVEARHPRRDGFANFYEWSKAEAEQLVLDAGLPAAVLRVATVIADDTDGRVTQTNAVHNTLRLYYYGLLSLLPGDPATPVYLVTGDFVSQAVTRLMGSDVAPGVYHVAHELAATTTLADFLDVAFTEFERHDSFRRRGVLRPLFCDIEAFDDLVAASRSFRASPVHQALTSVSPFARQLYAAKDVHNDRLREAYPAYVAPDPHSLVRNTCAHLISTGWRRPAEP